MRGLSALSATVLLAGCFRFEPLAREGPVPEDVAVEDAPGPQWVERGVLDVPNGLGPFLTVIGVVDGRLLCTSHTEKDAGLLPYAVWLRPSGESLEVELTEQILDRLDYRTRIVPGAPPTIFVGRLHSFEPLPQLVSKNFRLVEVPTGTTGIAASGSFVAYDSWFLISAMATCPIEGQTVHLARFDGRRLDVLESNDYNSGMVSFRLAADDRSAAVLIDVGQQIQLLRHDPDSGESTMRLDAGKGSGSVVRLRGGNLLCAWLEEIHDTHLLVYDGVRTSRIDAGMPLCEIDPVLLEDGSALVFLRHREGKTECVVWRDARGRWFRGRPSPADPGRDTEFEAFGKVWSISNDAGQLRVRELKR